MILLAEFTILLLKLCIVTYLVTCKKKTRVQLGAKIRQKVRGSGLSNKNSYSSFSTIPDEQMTPKTNKSYFLYEVGHSPQIATLGTVVLKDYANPNIAPSHVCTPLRSVQLLMVLVQTYQHESALRSETVLIHIQRRRILHMGQL